MILNQNLEDLLIWSISFLVQLIVASFIISILHSRSGYKRIAVNRLSNNEGEEFNINGCSTHLANRLIIKTEGTGKTIITFSDPVIDSFQGYLSEWTINGTNGRNFIIPSKIDNYTIKIKGSNTTYTIEYEWDGMILTKLLLSKLRIIK